jgi:hypothetical protein
MRPALRVALFLAALGVAAPAARADWLVLVGGKRIKTEGVWTLKGDLLTVHETSGRILTVGTSTVDTAACLRVNGGKLRIETVAVPMPAAGPVGSEVPPQVSGAPPARGDAHEPSAGPAPGGTAGTATGAVAGAPSGQAPAAAATPTDRAGANAAAGNAATGKPPRDDRLSAAKLARQARLQRELLYKQIVDGCTHMFILDRVGFQRCVGSQIKVPGAPTPPPASRP